MTIDSNDPKLTAYVLGELDEQDHAEVEAAISQSAELRRVVDEIRSTTDLLAKELVGKSSISLSADQRTAIETQAAKPRVRGRLSHIRPARWFAPLGAGASIAAVLAIAFSLGQVRYGDFGRAVRRQARSGLVSASNVKGVGTSAKVFANDSNERWMIPPFSKTDAGAVSGPTRKTRMGRTSSSKRMKRLASSSSFPSAAANGWGTPVHPTQYGYQVPFSESPNTDLPDGLTIPWMRSLVGMYSPSGTLAG